MATLTVSRRTALMTGATLPFAASVSLPGAALADGHAAPQNAIQNTFSLGEFQVSTLLVGSRVVGRHPIDLRHERLGRRVRRRQR